MLSPLISSITGRSTVTKLHRWPNFTGDQLHRWPRWWPNFTGDHACDQSAPVTNFTGDHAGDQLHRWPLLVTKSTSVTNSPVTIAGDQKYTGDQRHWWPCRWPTSPVTITGDQKYTGDQLHWWLWRWPTSPVSIAGDQNYTGDQTSSVTNFTVDLPGDQSTPVTKLHRWPKYTGDQTSPVSETSPVTNNSPVNKFNATGWYWCTTLSYGSKVAGASWKINTISIKVGWTLCPIVVRGLWNFRPTWMIHLARESPGNPDSNPGIDLVGSNQSSCPWKNSAAFSCHLRNGTRSSNRGHHRGCRRPERWGMGWSCQLPM